MPPRHLLAYSPTAQPKGRAFFFFSGYESLSDEDRLLRLRELPTLGDDIASLRAAGYHVVFEMLGDREGLERALLSAHPAAPGTTTAGVLWNGHGLKDGSLVAHDGSKIDPQSLSPRIAELGHCRLFVLACCWAGGHEERWRQMLGAQAHVHGWDEPITVATGVDFFTPDPESRADLDDLLRDHLGASSLDPAATGLFPETRDLLVLDCEHAAFFGANPLAPDPRALSVGQDVLGQWKSGSYYPATLAGFDGQRYLARWHDGDQPLWLQPYQVRPLGSPREMVLPGIRVGARVKAQWKDGSYYAATLADFVGGRYLARWHDGDQPLWVLPSQVYQEGAGAPAVGSPEVGQSVSARWKDGRCYPGTITAVDGDRCLVAWDDGDEPLWVSLADINER